MGKRLPRNTVVERRSCVHETRGAIRRTAVPMRQPLFFGRGSHFANFVHVKVNLGRVRFRPAGQAWKTGLHGRICGPRGNTSLRYDSNPHHGTQRFRTTSQSFTEKCPWAVQGVWTR